MPETSDTVVCDVCSEPESWSAATHFPHGVACRKPTCFAQLRARLAHIVGEDD